MTAVAMDARILSGQKERVGIAQYIAHLLAEYRRDHHDVDLQPLSYEKAWSAREGVPVGVIPRIKGVPWQSILLPWYLRRHHYDVFHGPAFSIPPWSPVPAVVTIHDATFFRMPQFVRSDTVRYLTRMVPRSLRQAARIIVPSHQVKDDLLAITREMDPKRITVISLGSDRLKDVIPVPRALIDVPYFLHVGTVEPRKNLEFLLEVFACAISLGELPHHLVLAGSNGWNNEAFWRRYEDFRWKDRVHVLGYVSDRENVRLYQDAALYLAPSHYEGFGLGVFEALWQGCPVIASPTGGVRDYHVPGLACVPLGQTELWARHIIDFIRDVVEVDRRHLPTWYQTYAQHARLYREVKDGAK